MCTCVTQQTLALVSPAGQNPAIDSTPVGLQGSPCTCIGTKISNATISALASAACAGQSFSAKVGSVFSEVTSAPTNLWNQAKADLEAQLQTYLNPAENAAKIAALVLVAILLFVAAVVWNLSEIRQ